MPHDTDFEKSIKKSHTEIAKKMAAVSLLALTPDFLIMGATSGESFMPISSWVLDSVL